MSMSTMPGIAGTAGLPRAPRHPYLAIAIGLAVIGPLLGPQISAAQEAHLAVIVGIGGDAKHRDRFHEWAVQLVDNAIERAGLPAANVHYLGEKPDRDTDRIDARSTRENVEATLDEVAAAARPNDKVFIVLIGHGTSNGGDARFNLPGPDLAAADFATLLVRFPTQRVVFANLATASGEFVTALSGPRRTIITATKTGRERNDAIFGGFFTEAFGGESEPDLDKDGHVSMLEAYTYARRQVAQTYENDGLLLTEHALLDDNGDGEGSHEPDPETADGAVARTLFLAPRASEAAAGVASDASPELQALYTERQVLEERIDVLRASKPDRDPARYSEELEALIIELARKGRAIREMEGRTP